MTYAMGHGLVLLYVVVEGRMLRTLPRRPFAPALGLGCLFILYVVWSLAAQPMSLVDEIVPASHPRSADPGSTFVELIKLFGYACVTISVAALCAERGRARLFVTTFLAAMSAYLLVSIVADALMPGTIFGFPKYIEAGRFSASFISPNTAATLCGMLLIVALSRFIEPGRRSAWSREARSIWAARPLETLALALALGALIMTDSRAGILVSLLVAMIYGAVEARRLLAGWSSRKRLFLVIGLVILFVLVGIHLNSRLGALSEGAIGRHALLEAHSRYFRLSPWFGYGLGTFKFLHHLEQSADAFGAMDTAGAVHNLYIQWLEQAGIIGAGLMSMSILSLLVAMMLRARFQSVESQEIRMVLAVSLLLLLHGFVDYALEVPSMAATWSSLLGLGGAAAARSMRRAERIGAHGPREPGSSSVRADVVDKNIWLDNSTKLSNSKAPPSVEP